MTLSLHLPGTSPLHRAPAGAKLALLAGAGVVLFLTDAPGILGAAALAAGALLGSVRPTRAALRLLVWPAVILGAVFAATLLAEGLAAALAASSRLAALVLLATAVTLATPSSAMLDALERALKPLERLGLADAARVSLAVSLVLRFVPEIVKAYGDVREAQAARGLEASAVALVVPLVVRTLKSADGIAEAIDARGYPPGPEPTRTSEEPSR